MMPCASFPHFFRLLQTSRNYREGYSGLSSRESVWKKAGSAFLMGEKMVLFMGANALDITMIPGCLNWRDDDEEIYGNHPMDVHVRFLIGAAGSSPAA
jgi:hypothetical protein